MPRHGQKHWICESGFLSVLLCSSAGAESHFFFWLNHWWFGLQIFAAPYLGQFDIYIVVDVYTMYISSIVDIYIVDLYINISSSIVDLRSSMYISSIVDVYVVVDRRRIYRRSSIYIYGRRLSIYISYRRRSSIYILSIVDLYIVDRRYVYRRSIYQYIVVDCRSVYLVHGSTGISPLIHECINPSIHRFIDLCIYLSVYVS